MVFLRGSSDGTGFRKAVCFRIIPRSHHRHSQEPRRLQGTAKRDQLGLLCLEAALGQKDETGMMAAEP